MTFSEINCIGNGTSSSREVINTIYTVNVYRRQKGEGRQAGAPIVMRINKKSVMLFHCRNILIRMPASYRRMKSAEERVFRPVVFDFFFFFFFFVAEWGAQSMSIV